MKWLEATHRDVERMGRNLDARHFAGREEEPDDLEVYRFWEPRDDDLTDNTPADPFS